MRSRRDRRRSATDRPCARRAGGRRATACSRMKSTARVADVGQVGSRRARAPRPPGRRSRARSTTSGSSRRGPARRARCARASSAARARSRRRSHFARVDAELRRDVVLGAVDVQVPAGPRSSAARSRPKRRANDVVVRRAAAARALRPRPRRRTCLRGLRSRHRASTRSRRPGACMSRMHPVGGFARDAAEQRARRSPAPRRRRAQQLAVVVQHLLEVRDHPVLVDAVAREAAAELVVDAAFGHALAASASPCTANAGRARRSPRVARHWRSRNSRLVGMRKLRRAAEAAELRDRTRSASCSRAASSGASVERRVAGAAGGGMLLRTPAAALSLCLAMSSALRAIELGHAPQQLGERRQAVARLLRESRCRRRTAARRASGTSSAASRRRAASASAARSGRSGRGRAAPRDRP